MLEPFIVAAFPTLFLVVLIGGRASMRRRNIDMEGIPPIDKNLFHVSKLAMGIPWVAMFVQSLGVNLAPIRVPRVLEWVSLSLWVLGFGLMLAGRIGMGNSFRVGCARERTSLITNGVFAYSRNPIYLGMNMTFLAAALYTMNPLVLVIGAGLAAIHHRIILGEEECLRKMSGQEYEEYCRRVGRYL